MSRADISEQIFQSTDTRLPLGKRLAIRMHVVLYSLCRRYEEQLQLVRHGLHHYANPDENAVAESLSAQVKERLIKAIENSAK